MPLQYADRVKEVTTTTGIGPYTFGGAFVGFQSFAVVGDGNTCEYGVTDGTEWETGLGTYSAPGSPSEPTLARTTIYSSSNGNNAVNWGAGSKEIFLTLPASRVSLLGTVTSIAVTGANGIGVSGSPITSTGTIGLSLGAITPTSVSTPSIITASGALGITPAAGFGVNLSLSTTGDFAVNTNHLFVDTSAGAVGVGTTTPSGKFDVRGATYLGADNVPVSTQIRLVIDSQQDGALDWSAPVIYPTVTSARLYFGTASKKFYALDFTNVGAGGFTNLPNLDLNNDPSRIDLGGSYISSQSGNPFALYDYYGLNIVNSTGQVVRLGGVGALGSLNINNHFSGTVGIGTAGTTIGNANKLQVAGTTAATNSLGISAWSADALGSRIELGKSRGAAIGTNTIVQNNDVVASVTGYGANGSTFTNLASISMEVDGTPGATTDMPGRVVISTVPDGSGTLTEAMRLSQDQSALFANTIKTAAPTTGTAAPWKLGTLVTGQVGLVMLSTQYLEVDVNGSLVKLATI